MHLPATTYQTCSRLSGRRVRSASRTKRGLARSSSLENTPVPGACCPSQCSAGSQPLLVTDAVQVLMRAAAFLGAAQAGARLRDDVGLRAPRELLELGHFQRNLGERLADLHRVIKELAARRHVLLEVHADRRASHAGA